MNLFRFLKSTKGAVKPLNALLISGAAGAVFFYTVNTAANKQIQAERAVRTLTSIEGTAPQQGMHRQGGLLTSINVRDGRGQLATADERAAMKGNNPLDRYEANQRALDNMDASLGRAAQFSESEGLNTGNRNAVQAPDRFTVGQSNTHRGVVIADDDSPGGRAGNASGANRRGGGAQLASASMARASGSSFGGTPGAVSGGISGPGGRGGAEGPARLSGAMPGGSNIVSQRASAGLGENRGTSSFGADRNARMTRSRRSGGDANELKDIVKKSAAAAQNTGKDSANEGGRAFLASAVNSGGVQVSGSGEEGTSSSGDLAAPTDKKLKAIGNKLKEVEDQQEERNEKHRKLIAQLLATALGSIATMIVVSKILKNLDARIRDLLANAAGSPVILAMAASLKLTRWLIAGAMIAAIAGVNAFLFVRAKQFVSDYGSSGGTAVAIIAQFVAPIMVAAAVQTAITPSWKDFIKKAWSFFKSSLKSIGLSAVMPKI